MEGYPKEQIARELNKAFNDKVDTVSRLLRTLLTLAATLLTILLPLVLLSELSQPCRFCLLCGGSALFVCCMACIAGLLVLMSQGKKRLENLSECWHNYAAFSLLPVKDQAVLLSVPADKRLLI